MLLGAYMYWLNLPRNSESILAVDEGAGALHSHAVDLVDDSLGPDAGVHCSLHLPDGLVLASHIGAVEAGMQDRYTHTGGLQFL